MNFDEKKLWKNLSVAGTVITGLCLCVSLFQFFVDKSPDIDAIKKIDRLAINVIAFISFIRLCFFSKNFYCYAFLFYCYGIGNIFDDGNILGTMCLGVSFLFLNFSNAFRNYRTLKICLFMILPVFMLAVQYFRSGSLVFWISVMHIVGGVYIGFLGFAILYPVLKKAESVKTEKILEDNVYSQRDIEFLSSVLDGKKYKKIAVLFSISESSVKARMVELYRLLGVKDRTEFLTVYKGYSFRLGDKTDITRYSSEQMFS